ncbi:zinc finger BED domain-containing protein RICESLEEPER 2-like [Lactuca sativa]|uniref:zinc finger BED domain-containing protein RICESLEEPER 2-like n=1 Tax=Lactuca sativa TaxID=4236 RepID=UPI0022AEC74A|nr:zinc finger BED domain-containing protein RICESLEEPER 2-like [Lactuca sativa]
MRPKIWKTGTKSRRLINGVHEAENAIDKFISSAYLKEIDDVQKSKRFDGRSDGGIKSCRLHDLLRELCLIKAAEEKFYYKLGMPDRSGREKQQRLFTDYKLLSEIYSHGNMNSASQNHAPTASSHDVGGSGSNQQNIDSVDQQDGTNINDTVFDEDGDEVVGSKRATRSPAWQHFIKFKLNGEVKARCKYCSKVLGADSKNGTKHLLAHYKRCVHKPFTNIRQSILVQEKKVDGTTTHVSNYTFNADTSRKDLAEMIIVHEYPLSIVEHHGFRKFVGRLQPLFKVPCRNTIKDDIKRIYDYERDKTMSLLGKNKRRIAVTTDMWTSNHQKKVYGNDSTFCRSKLELEKQNYGYTYLTTIYTFIYVPCPHTSDVLSDILYVTLCDWNLDSKVSTLIVDNCTTNDAIIRILLEKLPLKSLMMNGDLFHMRCCVHFLNLIVQDGLSLIKFEIERIRESVAFWSASPTREQNFVIATEQLGIPYSKKLILDCKTRWNSTFLMLSVTISYKEVFDRVKTRDPKYTCFPTEQDWELASEICERLQLFYEVTVMFSGSKYPTANVFFPLICEIGYSLREWTKSPIEEIKMMADQMVSKFNKYWSVIHGIMGMTAVLDPQYKLKFVELLLPVLYGEEKAKIEFQNLEAFVQTLFQEYESSVYGGSVPGSSSFGSSISSGHRVGFKKLLSDIASITRDDDESGGMNELDNYLKEKLLPKDMELDLLAWWKTNGLTTCSEETEAYCRSVEFDYDMEEENTKESGTTSLDDFV